MFAQLIAFGFIFVTCGAQEQLTCLRTNPDNSLLNSLKEELNSLREELNTVRTNQAYVTAANCTSALLRGYMDLAGGWVAPFNGYQYKATPSIQSWNASRTLCQQWGGDLAQYGVRDVAPRITLYQRLSLWGQFWIGLSDSAREGDWRWLNSNRANTGDGSLWGPRYPTSYSNNNRDCAFVTFGDYIHGLLVSDNGCSTLLRAFCEKRVDD